MKRLLNPFIERIVNGAFRVDQYPDVFETLALRKNHGSIMRKLFAHKVSPDIRRHPLLFVHIPKNGGTSIKQSLYASDPGHATVRFYEMIAPDLLVRAMSFALLRDPVDRFLSSYDFLMNDGGSHVSILPAARRRLAGIRTVDDFLDYLESIRGDWLKVDTFARPQWWYVVDRSGLIRLRHLWILGEHQSEIATFLSGHGFAKIKHVNRTRRASRALSVSQLRRLETLYAFDFALHAAATDPGSSAAFFGKSIRAISESHNCNSGLP